MVIQKPKLFLDTKDFLLFTVVMLMLISLRLIYQYSLYKEFISKPFYFINATIVNHYPKSKNGREYSLLKLHSSDGLIFFISTPKIGDLLYKRVRVQIYPTERISFWGYLGQFYVKGRIKKILPKIHASTKIKLMKIVSNQHSNYNISSFYNAIFFATPISKELREKIAALGASHLVALSGFHLGILWTIVYSLLALCYRPLQQRYFPYRFVLLDIGFLAVVVLGIYVWFVDSPPSLLRAYAMVLIGWITILAGIELISFVFLAAVGLMLILIFPSLLVSLGFWLSIAGVFYIFLILKYTQNTNNWLVTIFLIPFGIFALMLPIVHYVFETTTPYQMLSVIFSILFILFYPIVMLLHLFGEGALMDDMLTTLFVLPNYKTEEHLLPFGILLGYIAVSIWAIWSKQIFYLLLLFVFGYASYLYV